jgi:enoyl-[acyl-carrier protein] reductase II
MNRVTSLFGIRYPIIQGGMVWCSGWRLAAAVSNAGGLGLLGAGSMHPETLREHIRKCREATHHAFGVNIPLMYPQIEEIMAIGDQENDIAMIEYAGVGVAMDNAIPSVKEVANFVTKSNLEDGVAFAIEKYVLN